jgi:hypothetical protein
MVLCGSAYDQQGLVQNDLFLTTGLPLFLPTLNHGPILSGVTQDV